MEVLYPRCAGLDVHKDMVMARVRRVSEPQIGETRSFATTTGSLIELQEWLSSHAVTHVAMEATGVYWKPVWHLLEEHFELILANAQHIKNVPGRKTDVNDAAWIADLLAHGLISASFVPPAPIQELRDLTRTRKQLVREVSQHSLRIQKTLEDANLKLGSVLSNVLGRRRGAKKAILAVAASMLNAMWHMLKNRVEYQDLGADHFARRDRSKAILRLVRRLNDLGCQVELTAQAA